MFFYKIHRSGGKTLLAVCDHELAGKKFEEGKLALHVKREFYCGGKMGEGVIGLFSGVDMINITGDRIVKLAIKNKWVSENAVIRIKGVPHAQIIFL